MPYQQNRNPDPAKPANDKPATDSGGHRTPAGSNYGDHVPDRGQPRRNDDRDHASEPTMGDYYTGGGNIDKVGEQPAPQHPHAGGTGSLDTTAEPCPGDDKTDVKRNKSFDTPHTHSSTTPRNV
ncbi:hypothetical protein [Piscinibacter sp.]|uniref:hypothetical protein n=1 Tax=Piscinibacter sp. TaxID=1903157 RepID=UPI002CB2209B|nr:hypothetical protein [Albitalea sp.]HUG24782.1 hypothetical protein [Albitalea sp.]